MFDHHDPEYAIERGQRYAGTRKPSAVLEAMEHDLHAAARSAMDGGHGIAECYRPIAEAMAYVALARSNPSTWDVTLRGEDEEWLYDEAEPMVMASVIHDLCAFIESEVVPPYQRYGWLSDDEDDDGYERFGLWIDWARVDRDSDAGRLVYVDDRDDVTDPEFRRTLTEPAAFLAYEDGDDVFEIYSIHTGHLLWSL